MAQSATRERVFCAKNDLNDRQRFLKLSRYQCDGNFNTALI